MSRSADRPPRNLRDRDGRAAEADRLVAQAVELMVGSLRQGYRPDCCGNILQGWRGRALSRSPLAVRPAERLSGPVVGTEVRNSQRARAGWDEAGDLGQVADGEPAGHVGPGGAPAG